MKVCIVNDYPKNTGIGNYAFSLYNELKKEKGIEIKMIYLNAEKKIGSKDFLEINSGLKLPILNKTLHNLFVFPKKIPKGFDLYHCSNQFISAVAKHNKPAVVSCMDVIPKVLPKHYPKTMVFFLDRAMKQLVEAEKIITISEFTKKELMREYNIDGKKIVPIYLGFDGKIFKKRKKETARKKLGISKKEVIILNVGSEEERKNISTLLKAVAILKKKIPSVKLFRIGEERAKTRELIEKFGLQENVRYFNSVDLKKLGLFYNCADVFAFASYYEGFGLPLLEAMASGTPSICTKKTSIPEIVGNAAEFFEPFSELDLAEKILKILKSRKLQKSLSKNGIERAKMFSWKNCAKQTLKVYRDVLK